MKGKRSIIAVGRKWDEVVLKSPGRIIYIKNHLDAGFSQVDAKAICVPCVVLHLGEDEISINLKILFLQ